jgi:hypothetical protein
MNNNPTRLECLPNETFFEIFEYLDGRDVYRAFDNLNSRFNALLRALDQLSLTLSPNDNQDFDQEIFSSSIHTLIVNNNANVIIGHFPNLRHLILHWLPANVIDKLECDILPYLEYLSVDSRISSSAYSIFNIDNQIFTNGFSQLKFCYLPNMPIGVSDTRWRQTPSINVLKIGRIDLYIYQSILSSCPNLRVFEFAIDGQSEIPMNIEQHPNIKILVIKEMTFNKRIINMCLSCVPNVQRLDIHAKDSYISSLQRWSESDWFKPIIDLHLSKLRRMNFNLLAGLDLDTGTNEYILGKLERSFSRIQTNRYQTKLIIDRKAPIHSEYYDDWDE